MNTDIVVKNYEVYCRKFSQVIQAGDIHIACSLFYSEHPNEEIIIVENIEARNESPSAEVKEQQGVEATYSLIQFVKNLGYMNGTKPQHEFSPKEIYQSFLNQYK